MACAWQPQTPLRLSPHAQATNYGDNAQRVIAMAEEEGLGRRLVAGHPLLEAEVMYCALVRPWLDRWGTIDSNQEININGQGELPAAIHGNGSAGMEAGTCMYLRACFAWSQLLGPLHGLYGKACSLGILAPARELHGNGAPAILATLFDRKSTPLTLV